MRFTTVLLTVASAVGVLSAQTCGDLHNQESLLSCVAAPVSILCTGANSVSCACSQLSVQTDCMSKYCDGTADPTIVSAMTEIGCGGSSPATTTKASGPTPASGGTSSTPSATKNAAAVGAMPASGMMVVAVVAVAYL